MDKNRFENPDDVIIKYLKKCIENIPTRFILDCETAMLKSIAKTFQNVKITGCVFHFFQICTLRLCFDVFDRYTCNYIIMIFLNDIPEFQSFFSYFETSLLEKKQKRSRRKQTFSLDSWNMFHELCDNLPTMNNSMEQIN